MMKAIKNFKEVFNMKLKKKIAAMGAAVMIMASMSAIGASAYQASYEDSYRIILA